MGEKNKINKFFFILTTLVVLVIVVIAGYFIYLNFNSSVKLTQEVESSTYSGSLRKFYIDATYGNDSNDGLTPEMAWKTIGKVNEMQFDINTDTIVWGQIYTNSQFKPGDSILFKRGEIWYEKLFILSSGVEDNIITFGAYGNGPKPIISGSECFSSKCGVNANWEIMQDNIYKLKVVKDIGVITENKKHLTFVSWEPGKDNLIKMDPGSSLFDYESKTLYLWTTNGDSPNNYAVEGGVKDVVLKPSHSEYFTVQDIEINYAAATCVKPENVKHAIFDNLEIHTCGGLWNPGGSFYYGNGVTITYNSEDVVVQNSTVHDLYDSAISPQLFWRSGLFMKNITIKNNVLYNAPHSIVEVTNWADNSIMDNIIIENNKIYNGGKGFSEKYQWNRSSGGPGIFVTIGEYRTSKVKNVQIKNNEIYNSSLEGITIGLNSGPVNITNNNIHNNAGSGIAVFDNKTPTITEAIIEGNQITNNGDGILSGENVVVYKRNNIIIDNGDLDLIEQVKKYFK